MPYTAQSAPDWVKELPEGARKVWLAAYNAAYEEYDGDEAKSNATASAAVKKAGYEKRGDKWVKAAEAAVQDALVKLSVFGAGARPSVESVEGNVAQVVVGTARHTVEFTEKDGAYAFGKPQRVAEAEQFASRESEQFDLTVVEDEEHRADWERGDWPVTIIRAGDNATKRRRYTNRALESLDPAKYEGLPMHIDHAGREGDKPTARSLRDFAGKVVKAWRHKTAEGVAEIRGMVHVFDDWLRGRGKDEHFRSAVGLSHVADIAGRRERVNGGVWQVVEEVTNPVAVDFVTRAAFGGRVLESELNQRVEDLTMLETLSLKDLRDNRADLVEAIEQEAQTRWRAQENETEAVQAARAEAQAAKDRADALLKSTIKSAAVAEAAKVEHGVPETARDEFVTRVTARVPGDVAPDGVTTAVAEAAKAEATYLKSVAPKPDPKLNAGKTDEKPEPSAMQKLADGLLG